MVQHGLVRLRRRVVHERGGRGRRRAIRGGQQRQHREEGEPDRGQDRTGPGDRPGKLRSLDVPLVDPRQDVEDEPSPAGGHGVEAERLDPPPKPIGEVIERSPAGIGVAGPQWGGSGKPGTRRALRPPAAARQRSPGAGWRGDRRGGTVGDSLLSTNTVHAGTTLALAAMLSEPGGRVALVGRQPDPVLHEVAGAGGHHVVGDQEEAREHRLGQPFALRSQSRGRAGARPRRMASDPCSSGGPFAWHGVERWFTHRSWDASRPASPPGWKPRRRPR